LLREQFGREVVGAGDRIVGYSVVPPSDLVDFVSVFDVIGECREDVSRRQFRIGRGRYVLDGVAVS
jgi:hypothetical protein